jgi:hypothetical protein
MKTASTDELMTGLYKMFGDLLKVVDDGFRHQIEMNGASVGVNDSMLKYIDHLDRYIGIQDRRILELETRLAALEITARGAAGPTPINVH